MPPSTAHERGPKESRTQLMVMSPGIPLPHQQRDWLRSLKSVAVTEKLETLLQERLPEDQFDKPWAKEALVGVCLPESQASL